MQDEKDHTNLSQDEEKKLFEILMEHIKEMVWGS